MFVYRVPCGPIQTNSYLLEKTPENLAWVIDPAEGTPLIKMIQQHKLTLKGILLTHGHFDHILGIKGMLLSFPDCPIYIHPADQPCLFDAALNGSVNYFTPYSLTTSAKTNPYPKELALGGEVFEIVETPGHTPGSVTIQNDEMMFTGDFLFKETIGRTDFQRSSPQDMQSSLRSMVVRMRDKKNDTTIYPGHYETTTWQDELQSNPFLARIAKNRGQ
jgi:hydroxyacylglutathione hydrolase